MMDVSASSFSLVVPSSLPPTCRAHLPPPLLLLSLRMLPTRSVPSLSFLLPLAHELTFSSSLQDYDLDYDDDDDDEEGEDADAENMYYRAKGQFSPL